MAGILHPHRYGGVGPQTHWRIRPFGGQDFWFAIAELAFAATPGGANLATGGTALGTYSAPANAFDGNAGTRSEISSSPADAGYWVGYAFASPILPAEVRLTSGVGYETRAPMAFWLDYSSNGGSTWVNYALCTTGTLYSGGSTQSFTVTPWSATVTRATARCWYIDVTANNGGWDGFAELEFRATSGGATLCSGGAAFCSVGSGLNNARNAFDGNNATYYTKGGGTGSRVYYLFPTAPNPQFAALRARNGSLTDTPKDFTYGWSPDGITRNTVATVTGATGWGVSEIRQYPL